LRFFSFYRGTVLASAFAYDGRKSPEESITLLNAWLEGG
jgi:hypothetical protein